MLPPSRPMPTQLILGDEELLAIRYSNYFSALAWSSFSPSLFLYLRFFFLLLFLFFLFFFIPSSYRSLIYITHTPSSIRSLDLAYTLFKRNSFFFLPYLHNTFYFLQLIYFFFSIFHPLNNLCTKLFYTWHLRFIKNLRQDVPSTSRYVYISLCQSYYTSATLQFYFTATALQIPCIKSELLQITQRRVNVSFVTRIPGKKQLIFFFYHIIFPLLFLFFIFLVIYLFFSFTLLLQALDYCLVSFSFHSPQVICSPMCVQLYNVRVTFPRKILRLWNTAFLQWKLGLDGTPASACEQTRLLIF